MNNVAAVHVQEKRQGGMVMVRRCIVLVSLVAGLAGAAAAQDVPENRAPDARAQEAPPPTATAEAPVNHLHHPGCGHFFYDGEWHDFPSAHIHSDRCGHFFYDGEWHLFAEDHVHGPGCGHFFYDGGWNVDPRGHVHGRGCGHVFVDGDWRKAEPGAMTYLTGELEPDPTGTPLAFVIRPPPREPPPPLPEPRHDLEIVPISLEELARVDRTLDLDISVVPCEPCVRMSLRAIPWMGPSTFRPALEPCGDWFGGW